MTNKTEERQGTSASDPYTYVIADTYPSADPRDRTATIYFNGLLCLCFAGNNKCSIAMNHVSSSHTPRFGIWQRDSCKSIYELNPQHDQRIAIEVVDAVTETTPRESVYVYGPTPTSPPPPADRHSYVRYCLDLEGENFHDAEVGKDPSVLGPRFYINNGFFCTYKPTVSEFERRRDIDMNVRDLHSVAVAITADIFLNPGEEILIKDVSKSPSTILKRLVWTSGVQWDIALTNACTGSTGCTFNPDSTIPGERSDFSLHYKATTVLNDNQFGLFKKPGPSGGAIDLGLCIPPEKEGEKGYYEPFSDPAPCAPMGFGRTSNLP